MDVKPTVAVALSGGVDSAMAAYRLLCDGYLVVGLHFITGFESVGKPDGPGSVITMTERAARARRQLAPICNQLGIDLHVLDFRRLFQADVVDYFIGSYAAGRTPNPCMRCNATIKFGAAQEVTRQIGAPYLATGHYARREGSDASGWRLLKGIDKAKDQSYFLARLNPQQLSRALFPLGDTTKAEMKRQARQLGLEKLVKGESQDVCFVGHQGYGDFIAAQPGFVPRPGPIEDMDGRLLGRHPGLHRFTIGQRRGINCPGPEPYYVVRLDAPRNCLVVGCRDDLNTRHCYVESMNWIGQKPTGPKAVQVKVRYRHRAVEATVSPLAADRVRIEFDRPLQAVTPGQGAVFYQGDVVLGGGWISDEDDEEKRL